MVDIFVGPLPARESRASQSAPAVYDTTLLIAG
jgi:hypothetical protein